MPICIFSPLSALHNSQHLSHRPFFKAFMLQPLVVTVISLLPNNQVIDWPPLSRKSAAGNLPTQIRPLWPCSSCVNENLNVNTKVAHTFHISFMLMFRAVDTTTQLPIYHATGTTLKCHKQFCFIFYQIFTILTQCY